MKQLFLIVVFAVLLPVAALSCLSGRKTQTDTLDEKPVPAQVVVPDTFVLPLIPETMKSSDARAKYLAMHYWDRFDFADRKLIGRPEITEQAFVDYIDILGYVPKEIIDASLVYTLHKAEADTAMYAHFADLFEKYFYDPNSPFRNEEFYIPVVRETAQSPLLAEEAKSRYGFQLEMALRNRLGEKATDFAYTTPAGQSSRLYDLKSEYTLLLFTDPECPTCTAVTEHLGRSDALNAALSFNSATRTMVTVLTVYTENDLEAWKAHLPGMPPGWLHTYDKSGEITAKKLYDLKAFPTIYLLDKDKNVILKDTSVEAVELFFSTHH